ncbi:hypothetical protein N7463_010591 [Penicillium fimorum]|uniref:Uncharacterized protein n=1 Tax=Penicillium fimorum TaxID=1882269 RepID=A0A9W9XKA0_9EURO|nr:hypothetical protein N7463_010591 [Penicillium fimorum]
MHAKTRPEPKPLAPPVAHDRPNETRSTIDQNPARMVMKTITCDSRVSAEDQVSKLVPAPSDLDKPRVDENPYNPPHCASSSWIQQLEQGVAD